MRLVGAVLRLLGARSHAARLAALIAIAAAGFAWWQGQSTAAPLPGNTQSARVSRVFDGDTVEIILTNGETQRVRLAWVDAPEHDQPYGDAAKSTLTALLLGREVSVLPAGPQHDRYGRLLAQIAIQGRDAGEAQLQAGMAWHYVQYARKDQPGDAYTSYANAEAGARTQQQGLWQQVNPMPPWQHRKAGRQ
ncbi:thermonuclease family protein [Chitinimonas sp. BJYL2]|uniref:thermonuclease family protein n=1 Tax=Chitinimonas sp. BJYL2 TaxID=2976696 RepID=UPI0022B4E6A5|nr:thermonuclease family protein [Chitinimonas sp. BJYL2]